MLAKLGALQDRIHGAVDATRSKVVQLLCEKVHPQVLSAIDTRVDSFRDSTLEVLPTRCEEGLKERTESSTVAWLVDKVLGDNTDLLIDNLLARFKPGITNATDGLSASAAEQIIGKLRSWLQGDEAEDIGGGAAGAAAGGDAEAEATTAGMEQLQVAEAEQEGAAEGAEPTTSSSSRGLSASAWSAATALAGGVLGLNDQLPRFEAAARELVHPLFERLKQEVWDMVPAALHEALEELVGQKEDEAVVDADVDTQEGSRGLGTWLNKVTTKLQSKAGDIVNKATALTLDAIDGPMQGLINSLVDDLEHGATAAAFQEIRQKLADYKLISADAAAT